MMTMIQKGWGTMIRKKKKREGIMNSKRGG
jgi:hypothetical protein